MLCIVWLHVLVLYRYLIITVFYFLPLIYIEIFQGDLVLCLPSVSSLIAVHSGHHDTSVWSVWSMFSAVVADVHERWKH